MLSPATPGTIKQPKAPKPKDPVVEKRAKAEKEAKGIFGNISWIETELKNVKARFEAIEATTGEDEDDKDWPKKMIEKLEVQKSAIAGLVDSDPFFTSLKGGPLEH